MSLDWDVRELDADAKARSFPPDENGLMDDKLHSLIWLTIPVKIGHLTDDNAEEFYRRMVTWGRVSGFDYEKHITLENVKDAVGLRTNVIDESREVFLDGIKRYLDRDMEMIAKG